MSVHNSCAISAKEIKICNIQKTQKLRYYK